MYLNGEHIEEVIVRKLNREASTEDISSLENWLNKDPLHKEEYQTLVQLWNDSAAVLLPNQFNTGAAWEKLSQKIDAGAELSKGKVISLFTMRKALAIAACFLITLSAFWFYHTGNSTDSISWQHINATENQVITLPDSSVINLRKGSTFSYASNFNTKDRQVKLSGEAYFDITHNSAKPFTITTQSAVITDLGTAFLLRSDDFFDEVIVTEGIVSLSAKNDLSKNTIIKPGQKGWLKDGKLHRQQAAENNLLSWKTKNLHFSNTLLNQVAKDLTHHYQVPVDVTAEITKRNVLVTVEFNNQTLDQVLEEIALTTGLTVIKKGSVYIIGN